MSVGGGGEAHPVLTCREVVCLSSEYGMSGVGRGGGGGGSSSTDL